MQWDFWTLKPESAHRVTILMSDRGTPPTGRHMNGYGSHRFNPIDLTKVWPHHDYPGIPVGRFTLNRNPENFFAQIEQPANMVPGIGPSPDKMLLGRLFSYPDAHRYRIGTNCLQLPVNQPIVPVHSYNTDGAMR